MGRRQALVRDGVSAITVGNLAIALSVAALLAAGPRLLSGAAFVALSLGWTLTTVFGYGLAMPTEQLVTRRRSARDARSLAGPLLGLGLAGVVSCLVLATFGGRALEPDETPVTVGAAAVGVLGWVALAAGRGRVAGAGRLHAYAGLLGVEAVTRLLLVGAAAAFRPHATWLLAGAVGGPILVSAGVALVLQPVRRARSERTARVPVWRPGRRAPDSEQAAFVLVAAGYQLCLNAAPLVLAWRVDAAAREALGGFVIASSYYRLAAVLGAGFATQSLVALSSCWAQGRSAEFGTLLRRAVLTATAVTSVATVGAVAVGPFAVPLLNGRDPGLPWAVIAALAVSTVVATAASVATTGLMAAHRGGRAALWWLLGATAHLALLTTTGTIGSTTALALLLGPAVALAGVLATARPIGSSRGHTP